MAIATANIMLVIILAVYYKVDTGFTLARRNAVLFMKSFIFLGLIFCIPDRNVLYGALKIAVSFMWLTIAVSRREAKEFAGLIFSSLRRKGKNA